MMYKYSEKSKENLGTCETDLQVLFNEVIKYIDCSIIEGHRDMDTQNDYFHIRPQKSKLRWPHSKHNGFPSMAIDVYPYPIDMENIRRFYYFGGIVMGIARILYEEGEISHRLRWGGDWDMDNDINNQNFNDLVHFELVEE